MKKLYEVITATHYGKDKEYSQRVNRYKVLAQTVEKAISKVKPDLVNKKNLEEFVDEVILVSTIDIE